LKKFCCRHCRRAAGSCGKTPGSLNLCDAAVGGRRRLFTPWQPGSGGLSRRHDLLLLVVVLLLLFGGGGFYFGGPIIGGGGLGLILLICLVACLAGGFRITKS